ncbi:hypothetical protein K2173_017284 [Erythroxylum novogranatense]|uniref:Putative plant transposon protein domain-containing protein n=1 Tax=Erythroxylum novogranatense TaxID=1862640 RepID=A0AAV8U6D8_9ROSI|nr:hypothetical protein K2173_017284 [Erythroxylum novogranatense]
MEAAMIFGRHVDFESLRNDGMDVEPEIVREPVYTNEVFDFWKNAQLVDNTIISSVDGISVVVTKELIRKVTDCPSVGETLSTKAGWMSQVSMKEEDVRRQLYGANDPWERKTYSLIPKARVLHAILFNCILPRAGSRHLVTTLDEQCLFYLLNCNPIDLPFLIFHYMIKGMKDTNSYPYGMLLTRIFKESAIPLHKGNRRIVPVKSKIDSITIRRMGLSTVIKGEADSSRKTRTEGERVSKKTPASSSRTQHNTRSPADEIRRILGRPLIKQASPNIEEKPVKQSSVQEDPIEAQPEATTESDSDDDEPCLMVYNYHQFLRKHKLKIRMVEVVTRRRTAIAICSQPVKKTVDVVRPMSINSNTWDLLKEDEKNFYDAVRDAATKPYPTKIPCKPCTIFPITEKTEIKVAPDIQPRYPLDLTKGKSKLFPEEVFDDLSADQIAEEVRKIAEACASTQNKDEASYSYTDNREDCPVGGRVITRTFIEFLVQKILRIRPLSNTMSIQAEALPLQGRQLLMLPAPFDLDIPETETFIRPPTIEIIDEYIPTSDAYTTSIPFTPPSANVDQASSLIDSPDELSRLRGEVNEIKETMNDLKKMMTKLLKSHHR